MYYSELKRQAKAQKKADEKAQKAAAAPQTQQPVAKKAEAAATADGEHDDQEIDPNVSLIYRNYCAVIPYGIIIRNITRCDCIMFNR